MEIKCTPRLLWPQGSVTNIWFQMTQLLRAWYCTHLQSTKISMWPDQSEDGKSPHNLIRYNGKILTSAPWKLCRCAHAELALTQDPAPQGNSFCKNSVIHRGQWFNSTWEEVQDELYLQIKILKSSPELLTNRYLVFSQAESNYQDLGL